MVGPDDIPGTGRFAVVQDPQGATFGLYRSMRESGAWDGTNIVGRFSWHELMTLDHNKWHKGYQIGFRCCSDVRQSGPSAGQSGAGEPALVGS